VTEPPSGEPPPTEARVAGGEAIDLRALAEEICRRYRAEFRDEQGRYGDAGIAWCVHDNQHILNWAVGEVNGVVELERELAWLAGVLEARDFPLDRLARDLEIATEVTGERLGEPAQGIADGLRAGAAFVRSRGTFLG
jgi:hypothetical protein